MTTTNQIQHSKKNGFTILEMLIVLLVVAVLLLVTLPNIQQKEKIIRTKG
ncbi:MAG: prepilin-type N-terminal cleavage/methylation domain-containing protein, partial [Ileibacterium sp.]|nr:prepilin-type N-terminal cleavage/methylation domain-containing protein [Ileibacterium sp.]